MYKHTKAYVTRNDMINHLVRRNSRLAEIGVFKGDFSQVLLDTGPAELHLMDPWQGDKILSGDKDGLNIDIVDSQVLFQNVVTRFKESSNVYIHRQFSPVSFLYFPDSYFDAIYIDGDHSYEGVKRDLTISYLKVKDGGWILGHDFNITDIQRAVEEFCTERYLDVSFITKDGCPSFAILNQKFNKPMLFRNA